MVKTYSTMATLGSDAIPFSLPDVVSNQLVHFKKESGNIATVLMFICNHCPFVKYIQHELTKLGQDYADKNILFLAINSNDIEHYPADSPENMRITAEEAGYPFPYLFDKTQEIARAYHAACTPDFFIYDKNARLVYRGQLDDARPGNEKPIDGHSIREALDNLLQNLPVSPNQKASMGCNIKWKNND